VLANPITKMIRQLCRLLVRCYKPGDGFMLVMNDGKDVYHLAVRGPVIQS
jgi:hypothetical protein